MWIVPKNLSLPVSSGSTDMVEMLSDLNEQSLACSQSLSVRGTPSSLRTWSAKWKRDSWTQYLSGRMLRTSPQNHSAISSLISSWLPTRAKVSAMPAKDLEPKTTGISGPTAESSLELFAPDGSGLKTSKDTSRLDSPQSLQTWKKMVTQRRGEYSARLKSARLTSGKECLSSQEMRVEDGNQTTWSTPRSGAITSTQSNTQGKPPLGEQVRNWPSATVPDVHTGNLKSSQQKPGSMHSVTLPQAVEKMWPTAQTADGGKIGCQANYGQKCLSNYPEMVGPITGEKGMKSGKEMSGPPAQDKPNTDGSRRESSQEQISDQENHGIGSTWATPQNQDHHMSFRQGDTTLRRDLLENPPKKRTGPTYNHSAKLSPRWVETLMGLPMGWTSPDAPASLVRNWKRFTDGWLKARTEQTNCDYAETGLSPKPQSEPLKPSMPSCVVELWPVKEEEELRILMGDL